MLSNSSYNAMRRSASLMLSTKERYPLTFLSPLVMRVSSTSLYFISFLRILLKPPLLSPVSLRISVQVLPPLRISNDSTFSSPFERERLVRSGIFLTHLTWFNFSNSVLLYDLNIVNFYIFVWRDYEEKKTEKKGQLA